MKDVVFANRSFFIVVSSLALASFLLLIDKLDGGQWTTIAGIAVGAFNLTYLKRGT